jgi:ring-1,2-phenylacetyl-CoA epoxidase subunit PaaB
MSEAPMPLWEVFIRNRSGLPHKHCGSVHAPDATLALQAARDVYTRRGEAVSIWVVPDEVGHM